MGFLYIVAVLLYGMLALVKPRFLVVKDMETVMWVRYAVQMAALPTIAAATLQFVVVVIILASRAPGLHQVNRRPLSTRTPPLMHCHQPAIYTAAMPIFKIIAIYQIVLVHYTLLNSSARQPPYLHVHSLVDDHTFNPLANEQDGSLAFSFLPALLLP